ncbi:MAG: hypothetical protein ACK4NF_04870, partial [Planctomycetota bacterium]
ISYTKRPFTPPAPREILPLKVYPFTDKFSNLKDIAGYISLNISDYDRLNINGDTGEGYYITNPDDTISAELASLFRKSFKNCNIDLEKENNAPVDEVYKNYEKFDKNKMFSGGISFWIKPQFINYGYNKISPSPLCGTISYVIQDNKNRKKQIINEFGYIFLDEEDLFFGVSTNPAYDVILFTDNIKIQAENEFKLPPKTWTHIAFLWGNPQGVRYNETEKSYYYDKPDEFIKFFVNNVNVTRLLSQTKSLPIGGSILYENDSNLDEFFGEKNSLRFHWIIQDAPFEFTISKIRADIKDEVDILREYIEGIYYNGQKTSFFTSREFQLNEPGYFGSIIWHGFAFSQPVENFGGYISVINMQLLGEDGRELFTGRITDPRGLGKFDILLRNKFRYRAYFDLNLMDNVTSEPILHPPVLDEVMIIIVPLRPHFLRPPQ